MNAEREYGKAYERMQSHKRRGPVYMMVVNHVGKKNIRGMRNSYLSSFYNESGEREYATYADLIRKAWEARRIARRKCSSCKSFSRDEYGPGKHFCFGRYCRVSEATLVGTCKNFTPAPVPAELHTRLAVAMVEAGKEVQP